MSWSPDLYIGELRPWPDSVRVVRGNTDEVRRYMPEHKDTQEALERRIDELCAEVERLHADQAHWELGNCPSCPNVVSLQEALEQNAKLRGLVRDMWFWSYEGHMESESQEWQMEHIDGVIQRMSELGVEVS